MITAAQCRAARALLGISQEDLADLSEVSSATIKDFERGARQPIRRTLSDLKRALESRGILFLEDDRGEGVLRLRTPGGDP